MNYASFTSASEAADIVSLTSSTGYWVGITDNTHEGIYRNYNDGSTVSSFIKWAVGEPNNFYGNENCILSRSEGFYDHGCEKFVRVLCEIELPSSSVNIVANLVEVVPPNNLFDFIGNSGKIQRLLQ